MLEMLPAEPENLIAYRTKAKITAADFEYVADAIKAKAGEQEGLRLYAEMESFEGISPKILIQELAFGAVHFDALKRFDRVAVVTDVDLIDALAKIEDKVVPGIEVRTFPMSEKTQAMAWLMADEA